MSIYLAIGVGVLVASLWTGVARRHRLPGALIWYPIDVMIWPALVLVWVAVLRMHMDDEVAK